VNEVLWWFQRVFVVLIAGIAFHRCCWLIAPFFWLCTLKQGLAQIKMTLFEGSLAKSLVPQPQFC
jgi:hypothetical protein